MLKYWPILLVVLNGVAAWAAWSLRQLAVTEVRLIVDVAVASLKATDVSVAEDLESHERRLTILEEGVKNLPQREDFDRLVTALGSVGNTVAAQSATLIAVKEAGAVTQNGMDRLYRYFLEKGA